MVSINFRIENEKLKKNVITLFISRETERRIKQSSRKNSRLFPRKTRTFFTNMKLFKAFFSLLGDSIIPSFYIICARRDMSSS